MQKTVVLPYRAEFGIRIRYHVPKVYGLPRPVVVFHEPGLEALYPNAERVLVSSRKDDDRDSSDAKFVARVRKRAEAEFPDARILAIDRSTKLREKRFRPTPATFQIPGDEEFDVVVAPRYRDYGPSKNWDAWPEVSGGLMAAGLRVFAGGAKATSYDVPADDYSWNYSRSLDATIEAIRRSRLVLATDAGLAHLAVLCAKPLLIVASSGGLVAPGPVLDAKGRKTFDSYWPVRYGRYYARANWAGVRIGLLPSGWEEPGEVVDHVVDLLSTKDLR